MTGWTYSIAACTEVYFTGLCSPSMFCSRWTTRGNIRRLQNASISM